MHEFITGLNFLNTTLILLIMFIILKYNYKIYLLGFLYFAL